jgi:ATP-dependent RNA helicase DDX55/SPB4
MAPQTKVDRSFSALTPALSEWMLEAVDAMGFVKTTPVQHAAIPMFMKNSDVVVEAVTGSGKTLAYVLRSSALFPWNADMRQLFDTHN